MSNVFRVFPNKKLIKVYKGEGIYLYTKEYGRVLDTTGGASSYAILGFSHSKVLKGIERQMKKYTHLDYKVFNDENIEILSKILTKNSKLGLKKVYFSGNSGAESCEAALRLSYQIRDIEKKKDKKWFISRLQSYHGATSDALSLSERPNLEFYRKTLSKFRSRIPMHHPLYLKKKGETTEEYAKRSANDLEKEILRIGPNKVSGFVGETIMGSLVGDVPPAKNYWKQIRKICNKYDVHLIIDECYCGTGTSGKYFCIDWDNVKPDFLFISKTLSAGYGALGAVLTNNNHYEKIKKYGRFNHSTTLQGHSLSVAAAIEVQKIVNNKIFLDKVVSKGNYMKKVLFDELKKSRLFRDVRGRGLRLSIEHLTKDNNLFSKKFYEEMLKKKIFIDAKFHRTCFTPSLLISKKEIDFVLDNYIKTFKSLEKRNEY
tara:strand:+ start:203 stop:1492 length:1290 start_codon:yes stop_codon:yes gene_type:complete